jgi:hypothetical protein
MGWVGCPEPTGGCFHPSPITSQSNQPVGTHGPDSYPLSDWVLCKQYDMMLGQWARNDVFCSLCHPVLADTVVLSMCDCVHWCQTGTGSFIFASLYLPAGSTLSTSAASP